MRERSEDDEARGIVRSQGLAVGQYDSGDRFPERLRVDPRRDQIRPAAGCVIE